MTKLASNNVQILVGGYELTGDWFQAQITDAHQPLDITTFGSQAHHSIKGQRGITMQHSGYLDTAAGQSHPVLSGLNVDGIFSLLVGQNTAPTVGDEVFSIHVGQLGYNVSPEMGKVIPFGVGLETKGYSGGWGKVLGITSFTDTTTGNGVDNGAASSNGAVAHLHVLQAAASDAYSITIEGDDSSDFSTASTLATFTLDGSAVGSERQVITGSIPQYVRFQATRSGSAGDTVEIASTLIRF